MQSAGGAIDGDRMLGAAISRHRLLEARNGWALRQKIGPQHRRYGIDVVSPTI